ncbi:MAG: GntR family transcriptional regulator [Bacteroidetes bacterium 43-93]|nr:PLP-dependent aminotransferase family protein [Bacteroidota bacterium]OJW98175.1 MAG: GntR family transcriptional regulator [Bacteroidetes bacterium 43-93]
MKKNVKGREEHMYLHVAGNIEQQIMDNVLTIGDKLPSVRVLSKQHGVSISTTLQAYYHLEGKGLIESRPQSGYYVRFNPSRFPDRLEKSNPPLTAKNKNVEAIISEVYDDFVMPGIVRFSLSVPAPEILPLAKLNKSMVQAMKDLPGGGTAYEHVQGNTVLRTQVARWTRQWNGDLTADDLVTTAGCMNAISYCLMAITKPGDTIAVESPVYFGMLRFAQSIGLKVIELPTDPETGVDPDDVKKALQKHNIKAVFFVSNFSNPLGYCMPDEQKEAMVKLLSKHGIPLIEDDLYGDVFFGKQRPKPCKSFDEEGNVLWCSSISKTLAPGYRVGWVAPGKYLEKIKRLKLYHSITSATTQQAAIANFLSTGRYEHHLRKMRQTLHSNSLQFIRAIGEYFPEGVKMSNPKGGFILWMEMDKKIDAYHLYQEAMLHKISIAPGSMFTLQDRYRNCMRLSYGMQWTPQVDRALKKLGGLVKEMM